MAGELVFLRRDRRQRRERGVPPSRVRWRRRLLLLADTAMSVGADFASSFQIYPEAPPCHIAFASSFVCQSRVTSGIAFASTFTVTAATTVFAGAISFRSTFDVTGGDLANSRDRR